MRQAWLPAAPESVAGTSDRARAARELRLDGETTWELVLATTEAFANAVEHGAPCDPRGILMTMESRTAGSAWRSATAAASPPRPRPPSAMTRAGAA